MLKQEDLDRVKTLFALMQLSAVAEDEETVQAYAIVLAMYIPELVEMAEALNSLLPKSVDA